MKINELFAHRTNGMAASAIREILKVVSQPGMVSLAGGIPAPESIPVDLIPELTGRVLEKYGPSAFQYDPTEGFSPLRPAMADYLRTRGLNVTPEEVIITSGSQGALDEIGMVLIDRGDPVAVEAPTYLGALQAFNPYEPKYHRMDTDDEGLIPESFEEVVKRCRPKFVYLVPTFQNPTGRTIPLARREQIAEILMRENTVLVEDDPYGALRFRGEDVPPIKTLAPDHVVYITTMSKIFAPGLRVGVCVAPEPIRRWLVMAKQGVDLHTSTICQALTTEYLTGGYLDKHLPNIIRLYKPRQEAMVQAVDRYFPEHFTSTRPEGGMFLWAQGPKGFDLDPIYQECINRKAAFVPGKYFYSQPGEGVETMRLNFTMVDQETIDRAIKVIGRVIEEFSAKA